MLEPMFTRKAAQPASSVNVEGRTVDAVIATERAVRRRSWESGPYDEVLTCAPEAVDLGRAEALSLLDSHDAWSLDSRIGTIVPGSIRFGNAAITATLQLGAGERADRILADLAAGHRFGVSIGYRIDTTEKTEAPTGGVATVRAIRWTLLEVSLVAVPADGAAMTRNFQEETMPDFNELDTETERSQRPNATVAERTRQKRIRDLAEHTRDRDPEVVELAKRALDAGTSIDDFRNEVIELMIARQERTPTFPVVATRGMQDRNETVVDAMTDALLLRANPRHKPKSDSREFVGLSLPELARRSLEIAGISSTGMSASSAIERSLHSASDFPTVISNVGQRTLLDAYNATPAALTRVARQVNIPNFKDRTTVQLSTFSDLEKVTEAGEYKRGTFTEGTNSWRIETFGKVFGITRVALINDDLGAFVDMTRKLGEAASRLEATVMASVLLDNPVLADGKTLFHADHKNLIGTGTALTLDNLKAARKMLREQTGLAGELIDIIPKYLVVGLDDETTAQQILAAFQPTTVSDVNVLAGSLEVIVDRRINDGSWYVAADPYATPSLEYGYLGDSGGPEFFTREGFNTDGVETKVRLDFGAGWVDHRGWVKNPGN